jgi:RNA polymerase sigma-70 factor (ECF subfamily)
LDEAAEVGDPRDPEPGAARLDLQRLLGLLPLRQRRLVAAVKLAGDSVAEAARRESMSHGAVKVAVHRGLRLLSEKVRHED